VGDSPNSNRSRVEVKHLHFVAAAISALRERTPRELMSARPRRRFWIETGLGVLSGAAVMLTLVVPDWIEAVFGVDPDHSSGALEWRIVAVPLVATIAFGLVARREWRRPASELSTGG
jgi:hypothetical protein